MKFKLHNGMKINGLALFLSILTVGSLAAQNTPQLSGNFQANANFFVKDTAIGASATPQYEHQLFGAEAWLTLNYAYKGFDGGLRFDLFNNSNLPNPTDSYTAQGIGRWFIHKKVNRLDLTGGYFYDQIGSGIIFRSFEERALNIDNALYGVRAGYDLAENWKVKAFTGKQKFQFDTYASIIKGGSIDGFVQLDSARNFSLAPGIGIVGRTLDEESASSIAANVSTYLRPDSIGACYNSYAGSFYNTLTLGNLAWYLETAVKSADVMFDPLASKLFFNPSTNSLETTSGKLINRRGSVIYTSLSWSVPKFSVTVEGKQTKNFTFRTNPFVSGPRGAINFLPPMARQNTYRLTARFQPATQEIGERAAQADIRFSPKKKLQFALNLSAINNLDGGALYREMFSEVTYKYKRKWQLIGGVQMQYYNKTVYEGKRDTVKTVTPYAEFLYKFTPKRSVRIESQFMYTKQDFGSWAFALVEIGLAPRWIFTVSDMYKIRHAKNSGKSFEKTRLDGLHFWTAGAVYSTGPNRFSLDWVKQVEGIVCSGGICRYEPAFNGIRLKVNSNF